MNKDEIILQRMAICDSCEHYDPRSKRCLKVAVPNDPTRLGSLFHPNGVKNLKSRCPIRKWDIELSRHAIEVQKLISIELSYDAKFNLTRIGINASNKLHWLQLIVNHFRNSNLPLPKNSEVLADLERIIKLPNNY
jgi:hypothetical protein